MAKLCQGCQNKTHDTSVRGSCLAPNHAPAGSLPAGHIPWTDSPSYTLCEACAEHYRLCQDCGGLLSGFGSITAPTDKQFCQQTEQDDGNHVEGMYIGEQILAKLTVDMYSGKIWRLKRASYGISLYGERLVRVDGGRYGYHELYIDLNQANPKAEIELEEAYLYSDDWWWFWRKPSTSNKTWKITVEIKH